MKKIMKVSQLTIYPIKSLGGINIEETEVEECGLKYDRRWVLVDETNTFISQRKLPKMAKFHLEQIDFGFNVTNSENNEKTFIPFKPETKNCEKINVWEDRIELIEVSEEINVWFSDQLNLKTRLFFQEKSNRNIDSKYSITGMEKTSLSDGYPILIIGESSLEALNELLSEEVLMNRFRPNIVFSGGEAFCEDKFKDFQINNVEVYGVKPCARCQITTINQETLAIGKEPLNTLSKFRKFENRILFGQNLVVHRNGNIKIGDELYFRN